MLVVIGVPVPVGDTVLGGVLVAVAAALEWVTVAVGVAPGVLLGEAVAFRVAVRVAVAEGARVGAVAVAVAGGVAVAVATAAALETARLDVGVGVAALAGGSGRSGRISPMLSHSASRERAAGRLAALPAVMSISAVHGFPLLIDR